MSRSINILSVTNFVPKGIISGVRAQAGLYLDMLDQGRSHVSQKSQANHPNLKKKKKSPALPLVHVGFLDVPGGMLLRSRRRSTVRCTWATQRSTDYTSECLAIAGDIYGTSIVSGLHVDGQVCQRQLSLRCSTALLSNFCGPIVALSPRLSLFSQSLHVFIAAAAA